MRNLLISAAALSLAAAAAMPAFALNPQPLPPGFRDAGRFIHAPEPPDPCGRGRFEGRSAHFGDGSVHFRAMNEGWEQDRGLR